MSKIYNNAFYDLQSKESYESALVVLALLRQKLGEKIKLDSIIDFGCGVGSWLAAAKEVGFKKVCGTDGDYVPKNRLMISEEEFLDNNLSETQSIKLPEDKFDLAITLEVAEHLPESSANGFVEKIVQTSDLIMFSAAMPYQGGHGHVNENWLSYWCAKFSNVGYTCIDLIRPEIWSDRRVCWWYRQNTLVFIKNEKLITLPQGISLNNPVDIVHPEQYLLSVHREKTDRFFSLSQDISHFQRSSTYKGNTPLSYGREYSYTERPKKEIETLTDLRKIANKTTNSVLTDALAPVLEKEFDFDLFAEKAISADGKPDFLCVGAQKSGTTWLYEFMRQQDSIWLPPIKELNFFNQLVFEKDSAYSGSWRRGNALRRLHQATKNQNVPQNWLNFLFHLCAEKVDINWYRDIFKRCPDNKLAGEFTPEYLMLPKLGIKALKEVNPDMKIIMILRRPSERIESHLRMIKQHCPEISNSLLNEIVHSESVLQRSDYETILHNWFGLFNRNKLFIGSYDELRDTPRVFLKKIAKFLQVDLNYNIKIIDKTIHSSNVDLDEFNPDKNLIEKFSIFDEFWEKLDFD